MREREREGGHYTMHLHIKNLTTYTCILEYFISVTLLFFACRAASLEREKSISLQQLLNEKDEVLSSLKKQYEKMVEARVER